MKKNILLSVCLLLIVLLGSCSNTPTNPVEDPSVEPVVDLTQSYYPLKVGYWWEYTTTLPGAPAIIHQEVRRYQVVNGKGYHVVYDNYSNKESYMRVENNVVYTIKPDPSGAFTTPEYVSLNFNLALNDSTVFNLENGSLGVEKFVNILYHKDTSLTVQGTVYKDIQLFDLLFYVKNAGDEWILRSEAHSMYAKGIGYIVSDYFTGDHYILKDYSFKK